MQNTVNVIDYLAAGGLHIVDIATAKEIQFILSKVGMLPFAEQPEIAPRRCNPCGQRMLS